MSIKIAQFKSDQYQVSTPVYSGPLDLLLDLIESAELDITALSLALVTDQYLKYLNQVKEQDAEEVSAFLVIAAKLLQIKSAALLPKPPSEAKTTEEDPGEELARQLRAYKQFKELSEFLKEREEGNYRTYVRLAAPRPKFESKPDLSELTLEAFLAAARTAFFVRTELPINDVVNISRVTIKQKVTTILNRIKSAPTQRISFRELTHQVSRLEVVISFLAVLELYKQQVVNLHQNGLFNDIEIEATDRIDEFDMAATEFIDT
jgi:segregation and condensation protein A